MILQLSDFNSGIKHVAGDDYTDQNFDSFLNEVQEKNYIFEIFGTTLGQEFLDDLSVTTPQVPNTAKWQLVFSPFNYDLNECPVSCSGIKEILKSLFYRDFVSQQPIANQITGNSSVRGEASDRDGLIGKVTIVYNRGVDEIDKLQRYVLENPSDYSNFRGIMFDYQTGL